MAINQIIQFDIPANAPAEVMRFYNQMFGWTFEAVPQAPVEFHVAAGAEGPGIAVAVLKKQNEAHPPMNYVQVASIEDAVMKAVSLGAVVALDRMSVGGGRAIACLIDPGGTIIGVLQENAEP
jgi:predicted enzyme related to lactoylglutathione lyase